MALARLPPTSLATGVALTGTLAQVGAAKLAPDWAGVAVDYTRHGSSATGRPVIAIELSRDDRGTAPGAVGRWHRVQVLDANSLSSGSVESYGEQIRCNPSAAGTTTYGWPGLVDCRLANWIRVLVADLDAANPGTIDAVLLAAMDAS